MCSRTTEAAATDRRQATPPGTLASACADWLLTMTLFFVLAGVPPPDVNEAHYLGKAKHYWNLDWCGGDFFLNSADAHTVFYWTFGWLGRYFSLPTVAWIGRLLTWGLLAWSWGRLGRALFPGRLHSVLFAALFTTLLRWGHMAGEWVIGGVEAKGFAFVLLFLALESLVRGRWRAAWWLLGGATAFHVLVGGWSLIALGFVWLSTPADQRPRFLSQLPSLIGAGLLAGIGLFPAWSLSWSADPEVAQAANGIYVFERLSHHLLFHELPHLYIARHAALAVGWLAAIRWLGTTGGPRPDVFGPLHRFVGGALLIAIAGAVLDQSLLYFRPIAAAILRYYWFRLADVMIPLGATSAWCRCLFHWSAANPRRFAQSLIVTLAIVSVNVADVAFDHWRVPFPGADIQGLGTLDVSPAERQRRFRDWLGVCAWIKQSTGPDDLFLTPRHQQTFKWYAERSEIICAKDIPQDAAAIVEWRRRMDAIFPWQVGYADLTAHREQGLRTLARRFGFRYVVVDRYVSRYPLKFPRVYPETSSVVSNYEIYVVPSQ